MRDAHGRVGRVHRLTSRTRRSVHVDDEVVGVDVDLDLLGFGQNGHRRRRRVYAALALGDRHALHAVRTALVLHAAPHVVALQQERDLVEAAHVGRIRAQHLELPPHPRCVAFVHPEQVACKEVRLLATFRATDLDDDVLLVVGIRRQQQLAELVLQSFEVCFGLGRFDPHRLAVFACRLAEHLARRHRGRLAGRGTRGSARRSHRGLCAASRRAEADRDRRARQGRPARPRLQRTRPRERRGVRARRPGYGETVTISAGSTSRSASRRASSGACLARGGRAATEPRDPKRAAHRRQRARRRGRCPPSTRRPGSTRVVDAARDRGTGRIPVVGGDRRHRADELTSTDQRRISEQPVAQQPGRRDAVQRVRSRTHLAMRAHLVDHCSDR